jgi:hypothetical protein
VKSLHDVVSEGYIHRTTWTYQSRPWRRAGSRQWPSAEGYLENAERRFLLDRNPYLEAAVSPSHFMRRIHLFKSFGDKRARAGSAETSLGATSIAVVKLAQLSPGPELSSMRADSEQRHSVRPGLALRRLRYLHRTSTRKPLGWSFASRREQPGTSIAPTESRMLNSAFTCTSRRPLSFSSIYF